MTPGADKVITGLLGTAEGFGARLQATGKAAFDMGGKAYDNTKDLTTAGEASDEAGHHSTEETRENLDMEQ
ncbi:hypothetical protein [Amycolatopsis jiangsuensis]|uniref:Uncharacterized protein n=1 Tax=Amycolatopsis jiangsuensis TaxID=1181879 RepID=A0A840IYX0_9PSEU|nr:hypothetical protein [Amycolatopsis jiangsuensis]MBB4686487.1 hypothetical protein [Amycolatopsis jiangsuensis]